MAFITAQRGDRNSIQFDPLGRRVRAVAPEPGVEGRAQADEGGCRHADRDQGDLSVREVPVQQSDGWQQPLREVEKVSQRVVQAQVGLPALREDDKYDEDRQDQGEGCGGVELHGDTLAPSQLVDDDRTERHQDTGIVGQIGVAKPSQGDCYSRGGCGTALDLERDLHRALLSLGDVEERWLAVKGELPLRATAEHSLHDIAVMFDCRYVGLRLRLGVLVAGESVFQQQ